MNLKEICKPLENLYTVTQLDWELSVHHTLTEPTCPRVSIKPEGTHITRYTHHCNPNAVEETIKKLVELIHMEIVEGKVVGSGNSPFTNSDDGILDKWLNERKANKDLEFPYQTFYDILNKRAEKELENDQH